MGVKTFTRTRSANWLQAKLLLTLAFFTTAFAAQAQSGIFESYAVINAGGSDIFYDLQATTINPDFNGANLGSFVQCTGTPLRLDGGQNKTFKCPGDDITNGNIWYRVYPTGSPSGAFTSVNLPNVTNLGTGCSGNDQQWERTNADINLLTGRTPGNYTLEVYTTANFTFSGGGGGSGTHFSNNGGANYSATFTVTGGTGCPVFVTASGGTAFASYATLKAAFDAVNAGTHTGVIAITIGANTTETATAALNASGSGSASYTAISIQPGGGSAVTVSGNLALPLIDFNGADNVTINGLNSGGNSLTISNTSTSATSGTSTIRFIGGATSNTITNCSVLGSFSAGVTTNGGNIFFSTDANTANGNDNNTISNCNIGPAGANLPTKGIYLNGSTTTTAINNSGIIVNNNNIFDFFGAAVSSAGIYVGNGNTDCNFTNNRFYQTATRTQTTGSQHSAVWISNLSGNNFQVTGNTIGFASSTSTGIYTFVGVSSSALIPIFLNVGTTTASNASSNTIAGIAVSGAVSGTSFSAAFRGIYISSGLTTCNSNTIGSLSATGSISYTSSVSSGSDIIGIFNFGSSNWTASNNNIGGITAANSNTGASNIYGIRVNTTPSVTFTCQNNTIGGSVSNSISSTTTATGTIVNGILNSNPAGTITGNTIRNLTSAGGTGTGTSASVIGISVSASSANHTVSQNVIQGLSNTNGSAATTVTGINYSSSSGTNLVARNYIHSLSAASATAILNGINVTGGTTTYQNNMISLGSGISTGMQINGINETVAGTDNFYHNSVYIGGTGVGGSVNTFAFQSSITTNTRNYRDNIFVNVRSNGAGTGKHYAVRVGGSTPNPTGLTINYNDYLANGTGGIFGLFNGADVVSLAGWQTAVGQDANSLSADPLFVSGLDLHLSTNSPAESAGVLIASVTDDFDGQTRAGLTPTDIGADAGNFGPLCSGTPTAGIISSVPLSICNSGSAVLTLTGASFGNGITYQWKEATAPGGPYTNVGTSAATYTTGTISSARYYVVDVTCSAGPSTVTTLEYALVVNPLPTVAVTPTSGLICNPGGSAVSLTASGASTYSWSPSAGLNMTTGATVSANPAATTTYTVTGTDGNGCTNTAMVTVTVGTTPSNPVASASVSSVCPGVPFNLFSGADAPPATLLSQNFESGLGSWTTANLTTGGTPANTAWTIRSHGYVSPNSPPVTFNSPGATSFILSNADHGGSGTLVNTRLTSPTFSAVGYSTLSLSFRHYYRFNSAVEAFVEVSTDGGTNWTTVKSYNANQGTATVFATDNIDLAAYIGQSTVTIRFRYQNGWSWYWGIDDILLTGTPPNYTYSWSSTPSGFTSSTQNPTGVTATTTTTYTATITGLGGCTNTAQVVVTVNPAPTATVSGGGTVCSTDPLPNVDFALTGTGPWDLTYNDGTNNVPVLGIAASPYTITNAPAGTYTVVSVSDANCSGTGSGSVTVAVTPATTWYQDSDMDTYGNLAATLMACSQPVGYVANNTDCDDTDGTINPTTVWYLDADNDNYYVTGSGTTQCISPGAGYKYTGLLGGNDCADGNPAVNPGATEVCNDTDDDCDGMIDEGVQLTFYEDVDGDGFGDPNSFTMDCTAPMGFVANDQDCDDTNDALNPNTVWYLDGDNDNYYTGSGVTQCTSPGAGYEYTGLLGGNDCNDANNLINPGATEICDGVDNDCDGMTDDGITFVTYYVDGDNDGYGIGSGQSLCANPGSGFATVAGDCNDANNLINPGATEICADGIDNDCDTQIDENCGSCPATGTTWYVDAAAVSGGNGASWPCAFQQIQTAINAAANGDQIFVAAGTYVENLFVNKSLTITGVAGRDLTFVHAATAAYTLHVDGNAGMPVLGGNVSIEGFTFADPQRLHWSVVATDHIAIGLQLTFRNNRVTNGNRYGWWDYHSHGSLLCENNIFSDVYYGMFLEGWDTGMLTIQNNEFTNLHFYINPMGVPTPAFGGPVGILAMTYSSGGVDCTNPYRIYENHFHTYANDGFGIVFNGGLTGSGSAKYTDVEIARNTIAPGATGTGIRLRNLPAPNNSPNGGVHNALINNNFISNVQYGIRLQGDNPGTQAHENSLVNCSTRAIENTGTLVMDASCNWYGVSTATGVAAQISGNVTYQFWLVNGTDSDLGTLGFQPVAGSCTGCAQPVLQTTINTVVVTSNNDGTEDTGSFSICNGETVTFDNFQDISGLGLTGLKVYQTASYTNISPSFCNNCTDLLSTYTGMSQTASLVNPALSGTLVLRFKAWADANGNNMVDPEECAGDWVKYTITVLPAQLWYTDGDNDGYGTGSGQSLCANPGAGFATVAGDCNDANNLINPGATEICDGVDNDCDAMVDEGAQITYYRDLDGDGFGNPAVTQLACSPPSGYVANNTDCNDNSALEKPGQTWYADADNDNYSNGIFLVQCLRPVGFKAASELIASIGDCNDSNAAINPAAVETCDGVDNNCNGMIDDGVQTTYYRDMDGDGFGNPAVTQMACSPPSGYVTNNTDCNDNSALEKPGQVWYKDTDGDNYAETGAATITQCLRPSGYKVSIELTSITGDCNDNNAAINPAATEACDGVDNNCNGMIDDGVQTTYYRDLDGDGFGNPAVTQSACSPPSGYVANNTDCNDNSAVEKPGQVWYKDTDGDNYAETGAATITQCLRPVGYKAAVELTSITGDCNDNNAAINPAATETCDGVDNNCNGMIDDGVQTTYYRDLDGDGFGNPAVTQLACSPPSGYVANNTDCNDNSALEKPGQVWYKDTDGDNYAQTGAATITQCLRPIGYKAAVELTSITGDCNDNNAAINPAAVETCDGVDNNCNGSTDEGVQTTYYRDLDGDGFGNPAVTQLACSPPSGYVANNTDCNDNNALEKPGQVWYKDTDGDNYAQTGAATITQCLRPSGYKVASELTSTTGDCNDNNAAIKPGAPEICNSIDDDCDGMTDEGLTYVTYYLDMDGDGFGNPAVTQTTCTGTAPSGYVISNGDCNDNNNIVYPGAPELCDGLDNNCNGTSDEPHPISSPWSNSDVGAPGVNGSANNGCAGGSSVFNVSASGFSTSSSDKLHLVSQQLCGNGEIIARVLNVTDGGWAGVTLRESLAPGSKKVALKTQLSSIIRREIRNATNGPASILNFNRPAHVWLRLVRNGPNFTGYTSTDGSNWDFAFSATISMSGCIYAGLFAESINVNVTTNASFDNVSISGTQNLAIGGQLTEALNGLSVSVYPNPSSGEMTLSVAGAPERNLQLEVMDMMGKMVRSIALPEGSVFTYPLDLSDQPAGVYFLRLRSENGVESVQRIVVQQ